MANGGIGRLSLSNARCIRWFNALNTCVLPAIRLDPLTDKLHQKAGWSASRASGALSKQRVAYLQRQRRAALRQRGSAPAVFHWLLLWATVWKMPGLPLRVFTAGILTARSFHHQDFRLQGFLPPGFSPPGFSPPGFSPRGFSPLVSFCAMVRSTALVLLKRHVEECGFGDRSGELTVDSPSEVKMR